MARKLKTYQTSLGFFDLAVAAPSMKTALEAWGASSNLFHQGAAKETDDPAVVAAAMSKPGIVLKRPVGTRAPFREHAELPTDIAGEEPGRKRRPDKKAKAPARTKASNKNAPSPELDDAKARAAAAAFEKAERERERQRRKEEAAEAKARARRDQAVAKANAALDKARREHDNRMRELDAEQARLEERSQAEQTRWAEQKQKLEGALRRARD